MNNGLAEFVGVFIGDGCMTQYKREGRKNKQKLVLLTGSWKNDSVYYKKIIKNIIEKNFNMTPRIYHRLDDDTARVYIYRKEVYNFLENLGSIHQNLYRA